jgi:hypothetical protein
MNQKVHFEVFLQNCPLYWPLLLEQLNTPTYLQCNFGGHGIMPHAADGKLDNDNSKSNNKTNTPLGKTRCWPSAVVTSSTFAGVLTSSTEEYPKEKEWNSSSGSSSSISSTPPTLPINQKQTK